MPVLVESVLDDLKKKKYAPIYFLQGEEPFFIDQIADYIEQHALSEQDKAFNQVILYGKETDLTTVLSHARRFPMMAERQVVLVKEAQDMTDLDKEKEGKGQVGNPLIHYLKNPVPSTILVFCHKYKNLDARKSLAKEIDKQAVLVTTKKLYQDKVPDWIHGFVKQSGWLINSKAAELLSASVGTDLSRIAKEIEKVTINLKEKKEIDVADIQKYVGISKEYNPFELTAALKSKDVLKANQILKYFESDPKSNPAIQVISVVFQFYCKILQVHYSKNKDERSLIELLKVNPYYVKDYITASRVYSPEKTKQILSFIRQADMQCKGINSPSIDDGEILKELIFKILH